MPITVRLASAADFKAAATLRLAAYRAAPEFTVTAETAVMHWDGPVLVTHRAAAPVAGAGLTYSRYPANTCA